MISGIFPPLCNKGHGYLLGLFDRIIRILRIFLLCLKFSEEIPNEQSATTPRRESFGCKVVMGDAWGTLSTTKLVQNTPLLFLACQGFFYHGPHTCLRPFHLFSIFVLRLTFYFLARISLITRFFVFVVVIDIQAPEFLLRTILRRGEYSDSFRPPIPKHSGHPGACCKHSATQGYCPSKLLRRYPWQKGDYLCAKSKRF